MANIFHDVHQRLNPPYRWRANDKIFPGPRTCERLKLPYSNIFVQSMSRFSTRSSPIRDIQTSITPPTPSPRVGNQIRPLGMIPVSPKPIAHLRNLKGHLRNHSNMVAVSFKFTTFLPVKPHAARTTHTVSGGALSIPTDYILLKPVVLFDTGLGFGASCAEWSPGSLSCFDVMDRRFGTITQILSHQMRQTCALEGRMNG